MILFITFLYDANDPHIDISTNILNYSS